jgi:hypothetical protein
MAEKVKIKATQQIGWILFVDQDGTDKDFIRYQKESRKKFNSGPYKNIVDDNYENLGWFTNDELDLINDVEKKEFYCDLEDKFFMAIGYKNPLFYKNKIAADCPTCGEKCWEKTIKITFSEYKKMKDNHK